MKLIKLAITIFLVISAIPLSAKNMTILVHPFQNTGDKKFSWVSAGMTASTISDLGKIQEITVISESDRVKAYKEIEFAQTGLTAVDDNAVKVGEMLGANFIFTGNYLVVGNRIRVNVSLINVSKGTTERSIKLDGTIEEIFDLQDKIVFTLMAETEKINIADIKPVKISDDDRKRIENKKNPSLSAYELHSKALEIKDSDPNGAMRFFRQAIEKEPDYVDALRDAGFTAGSVLNLFDEAFKYLTKAEKILYDRGEKNTSAYSSLMMNFGVVYLNKGDLGMNEGDHDKALEYYLKSKEIFDRLGLQNTSGYSDLMTNLGEYYSREAELESKALEYYMKSKVTKEILGLQNTSGYSSLMMYIGIVYYSKEELDKALEYYMKSKEIKERLSLQNTVGYSSLMTYIGFLYGMKGQRDKALEYYFKSKEISDRLGL